MTIIIIYIECRFTRLQERLYYIITKYRTHTVTKRKDLKTEKKKQKKKEDEEEC